MTYLDERGLWLVVASGVVLSLGDLARVTDRVRVRVRVRVRANPNPNPNPDPDPDPDPTPNPGPNSVTWIILITPSTTKMELRLHRIVCAPG